jgi:hypothetical protein
MFKSTHHLVNFYIKLPSDKHSEQWIAEAFRGLDEFDYEEYIIRQSMRAHYKLFKEIGYGFSGKLKNCALIADCLVTSWDEAFYKSISEELCSDAALTQKILPFCKHGDLLIRHLLNNRFLWQSLLTRLCIMGDESIPDSVKDVLKNTLKTRTNIENVHIPFTNKEIRENFTELPGFYHVTNKRSLVRVWKAFAETNELHKVPSYLEIQNDRVVSYLLTHPEQMSMEEFCKFLRWRRRIIDGKQGIVRYVESINRNILYLALRVLMASSARIGYLTDKADNS